MAGEPLIPLMVLNHLCFLMLISQSARSQIIKHESLPSCPFSAFEVFAIVPRVLGQSLLSL